MQNYALSFLNKKAPVLKKETHTMTNEKMLIQRIDNLENYLKKLVRDRKYWCREMLKFLEIKRED